MDTGHLNSSGRPLREALVNPGVEVITSVQRRRRWSTEERVRIVEETYLPGNSVSPSHMRSE